METSKKLQNALELLDDMVLNGIEFPEAEYRVMNTYNLTLKQSLKVKEMYDKLD